MCTPTSRVLFSILMGAFLSASALAVPETDAPATPQTDRELTRLAEWMTGYFNSAEQAAADSAYYDIRLRMVPIWRDRLDGYWLYVEQAVVRMEHRPYRQRVYHVTRASEDTFESAVYELPNPLRFVGAWRQPGLFASLTPDSLEIRTGCSIILRKTDKHTYEGSTQDQECLSSLRGASYATSEVIIRKDQLMSWDRGFDEEGNQVWGATKGGYAFKRLSKGSRLR
ncbi:chromophore lyase CpcT/CpeT [Candidatus Eisenbacteria bacterium]|uniref:Chromophore lyase CpcT/CpeT n=1 Tax=Eiseniibacteriota bacterium TaxID=2212470 RepID=A0ABV6YM81_UNCEI